MTFIAVNFFLEILEKKVVDKNESLGYSVGVGSFGIERKLNFEMSNRVNYLALKG